MLNPKWESQGSGIIVELGQKSCKSHGWWIATRKQCFIASKQVYYTIYNTLREKFF